MSTAALSSSTAETVVWFYAHSAIDQDRIIRAKTDQTGSAELHNNLCWYVKNATKNACLSPVH